MSTWNAKLDECGFFRVAEKRPAWSAISATCSRRADLTLQEVRTLHGIVHELVTFRKKQE